MPTFDYMVRHSVFAKIALYVIQDSTDMSVFPDLTLTDDGRYSIEWEDTTYSVVPKMESEDVDLPGVNIVFLGPIDVSQERLQRKRYVIPVVVHVVRPLATGELPLSISADVWALAWKVTDSLRDGFVDIWEYNTDPAAFTGRRAQWVKTHDFSWKDESFAFEGGDIRLTMAFGVEYVEYGNSSSTSTGITDGVTTFITGG
jgi:hypothetical protein